MATIPTIRYQTNNTKAFVEAWEGLQQGDDGLPLGNSQYTDRSVQVVGVFGGASVALEGSNNDTDWAVLTDPQGNDLLLSTNKIEMVSEATKSIRPRVSGGDGTTDLSVFLLVKE